MRENESGWVVVEVVKASSTIISSEFTVYSPVRPVHSPFSPFLPHPSLSIPFYFLAPDLFISSLCSINYSTCSFLPFPLFTSSAHLFLIPFPVFIPQPKLFCPFYFSLPALLISSLATFTSQLHVSFPVHSPTSPLLPFPLFTCPFHPHLPVPCFCP